MKATEQRNMAASVNNTQTVNANNFCTEDIIERRSATSCSTATPSYQGQQQLLTNQSAVPSMPMQRKIYDLPEFCGTPEDWPMFLFACSVFL